MDLLDWIVAAGIWLFCGALWLWTRKADRDFEREVERANIELQRLLDEARGGE